MIGNMTKGGNAGGLLHYCYYDKENLSRQEREHLSPGDVRGEILYVQHLSLETKPDGRFDMEELARQMKTCANQNKNLKDYVWHQSFSFPPGENPTKDKVVELSQDFVKEFGFSDNQVIVFRHKDTEHAHFHIVANRIDAAGKTTAQDSFSHLKTGEFCRDMELKHGFQITQNMKALSPKKAKRKAASKSNVADKLRDKIDASLPKCKTMQELSEMLKKQKVKVYVGRGIAFVDKETGSKFKGSDLGREYSLTKVKEGLGQELQKKGQIKQKLQMHIGM